jgi:ABC-2 type transport system permease protein
MSDPDRGGASHPLVELTLARIREFVREPEALFWAFIFPIVMSLALAVAFPGTGMSPVLVGVAPGDSAAALRATLAAVPEVVVKAVPPADEARALREGEVQIVVRATSPPTYVFDGARAESRTARLVVDDVLKKAAGRAEPWSARQEPIVIAGSRYIDWLIPALIGINVMGNSIWGIGFSIVQARLRKLLKRMVASPMRKREFLLAQVLARMLFLAPEVAAPLLFGVLAFGLPVHGSLVAITVVSIVGALGFGGLGLLLASRARTIEAISGLANLVMLPMWIVSGVFFSSANFPDAAQPVIQALPLTALIDALRAVILEGATIVDVQRELQVLALWAIVPFAIALRIFRWR